MPFVYRCSLTNFWGLLELRLIDTQVNFFNYKTSERVYWRTTTHVTFNIWICRTLWKPYVMFTSASRICISSLCPVKWNSNKTQYSFWLWHDKMSRSLRSVKAFASKRQPRNACDRREIGPALWAAASSHWMSCRNARINVSAPEWWSKVPEIVRRHNFKPGSGGLRQTENSSLCLREKYDLSTNSYSLEYFWTVKTALLILVM